jgi:hypothetical protein
MGCGKWTSSTAGAAPRYWRDSCRKIAIALIDNQKGETKAQACANASRKSSELIFPTRTRSTSVVHVENIPLGQISDKTGRSVKNRVELPMLATPKLRSAKPCDLFPFRPGQSWDMRDQEGRTTHFETLVVQNVACHDGESVDMHITKTSTDAYWNVEFPAADIHWILHRDVNGAWRASASLFRDETTADQNGITINYEWLDANAYLVVPSQLMQGDSLVRTGYAIWHMDRQQQTPACLSGLAPAALYRWTSKLSVQYVNTPVYSGSAVMNEQFEGCGSSEDEQSNLNKCAHEQWFFAPRIGLVEINALWENVDRKRIIETQSKIRTPHEAD